MGITPIEAQQIANLIPRKTPAETYTIAESLEVEPKLKALYDTRPAHQGAARSGAQARGPDAPRRQARRRHRDQRGAALGSRPRVFASDEQDAATLVTQYYKDDVEQAGLVKFDFLGLKTLTVLDIAVRLVNARPDFVAMARPDSRTSADARSGAHPDGRRGDLQAPRVRGDQGRLPARVERDAAALQGPAGRPLRGHHRRRGALPPRARSGAGWSRTSSTARTGARAIASLHPLVDELLAPTYGVIVYQEQVMQIAQKLAGYTLGGADLLRRAMGKKKPEEMAKQKSAFVEGRQEQRRRGGGGRAHLRAARVLRRLRLQQEPLRRVRAHHLPDRVAQGALPGGAALRDPHQRQGPHREGGAYDRRRARDGGDRPAARRQRERHRLQGRLHAPRGRQEAPAKREGPTRRVRPGDPLRPRGRARARRRGARGGVRGARRAGPSAISSTWRRASTRSG